MPSMLLGMRGFVTATASAPATRIINGTTGQEGWNHKPKQARAMVLDAFTASCQPHLQHC